MVGGASIEQRSIASANACGTHTRPVAMPDQALAMEHDAGTLALFNGIRHPAPPRPARRV